METENRLTELFANRTGKLSIYITAGYPTLDALPTLLEILQEAQVDFVEIGIPFSDSVMDGPTIVKSHETALNNGMTVDLLLSQISKARATVSLPIVIMGSMNLVYQYGFEKFCDACGQLKIDGLLLPDLPLTDFKREYQLFYKKNKLAPVFMVTPETTESRFSQIDAVTEGFLYAVSSSSTTGASRSVKDSQAYFERLFQTESKNPVVVGFNIKTKEDIDFVGQYASGAIIGSAFIKILENGIDKKRIFQFIAQLR